MKVKCPEKRCTAEMKLGEGFGECEVGLCICHASTLAVTGKKEARKVIVKPDCLPLKKGDLAVVQTSSLSLKGPSVARYTVEYVGSGGKKPRGGDGAPIETMMVVAVVRPGWQVKTFIPIADTPEEAIRSAWEHREDDE